ncbi:DUF1996 domain-containing protein [Streptomyces sp. NPDC057445]|uniref:DUF1996 domain-containing protein n=1 Tax=Streptomyces sp. NPDC057445 TaxID=3346136 RepID=UPI00367AFD10
MLGGGGLIAVNSYASAGEGWGPWSGNEQQNQNLSAGSSASTIKCPEVANGLSEVPDRARPEVDRELATLDSQITEAYQRFVEQKDQIQRDSQFAQNAVLGPLEGKRAASIDRIAVAISRAAGARPQGLEAMAPCTLQVDDADEGDAGQGNGEGQNQGDGQDGNGEGDQDNGGGQDNGDGGQAGNGPEASDFADIQSVQPNVGNPERLQDASRGTFSTECGVNANGKFNPDNVIVAPGVSNGAHHMHDYVGNQANDAFASDDDLANGDTSCRDQGDKSTYYWPVLRLQNGQDEKDVQADGGGKDKNTGQIQTPAQVTLNFVGSPVDKVTEMPRFLRIITGDAKAFVNGNANANASWSCTGFEDRQLKDKYPICPQGSKVVRSFKFQSCWDGQNTDSANHRTHVAFADQNGRCQNGFKAIPQLVQRIVYDVPPPVFDGNSPAVFAVDSFPEQLHKPVTDHGDFINVFDDDLMRTMVSCINEGRECGPGDTGAPPAEDEETPGDGGQPGAGQPGEEPAPGGGAENPGDGGQPGAGQPGEEPAPGGGEENPGDGGQPGAGQPGEEPAPGGGAENPGDGGKPGAGQPGEEPAPGGGEEKPEDGGKPGAGQPGAQATPDTGGEVDTPKLATGAAAGTAGAQATPDTGGNAPAPAGGNGRQAAEGGLASTGAQLWPSAAGAVLLIAGVLLLRTRNRGETARRR